MKKKKKRSYSASDLVRILAKKYGFEDKLKAFEVKKILSEYLDSSLFEEIRKVDYSDGVLIIYIRSPLLRHDFQLRKKVYLEKFNDELGQGAFTELIIR